MTKHEIIIGLLALLLGVAMGQIIGVVITLLIK